MNDIIKGFLENMKVKIEEDVLKDTRNQVGTRVAANLTVLVDQGIITKADATAFAKENGIAYGTATRTPKSTIADDGCGHGGRGRMSSC